MAFEFPWAALGGGMLLGVSATLLLLMDGKIAGISGILSGLMRSRNPNFKWQLLFVVGMIISGWLINTFGTFHLPEVVKGSTGLILVAGFLVGIGTCLGNGCTSGHGICGMGRLSKRSIVATCVFMLVAIITVFVRLHLL